MLCIAAGHYGIDPKCFINETFITTMAAYGDVNLKYSMKHDDYKGIPCVPFIK